MGYSDLAAFGSPNVSTPHIDRLIERGVKLTHWISAAPICTPSRAAIQTGRYPIRSGCVGVSESRRVIPTPTNPGGLDPETQLSLAAALKIAGYRTGMSGKWHLGDSGSGGGASGLDHKFHPTAHGYDSYLGSPFTNTPACQMDAQGVSNLTGNGPTVCFMQANTTVVQQPLHLENFTQAITDHAISFIQRSRPDQPFFFMMAYFHVHTPLFTNRANRGRSIGGEFGDNVEELDDSVGAVLSALDAADVTNNTLIFLTSDNGPYQEEGWDRSGRTNVYSAAGKRLGRLKGGKGQLWEGGIRMPGAVVWPGVVPPGSSSEVLVSSMDIFPTALQAAGVDLAANYTVDGQNMLPVLKGANKSAHATLLHYCGFEIPAVRVDGTYKVFFKVQKWYTNDRLNASVCVECCNGINPLSRLTPIRASELCGCGSRDFEVMPSDNPLVYNIVQDPFESNPLNRSSLAGYDQIIATAKAARDAMLSSFNPKPDLFGAGVCTAGFPSPDRQPCCPGCLQPNLFHSRCHYKDGSDCYCNDVHRNDYNYTV